MEDYSSSYWKSSETVALVAKIDDTLVAAEYDKTLTSDYIDDDNLPFFVCSECSLDCKHGSSFDAECTNCDDGCPIEAAPGDNPRAGIECDQVHCWWICMCFMVSNCSRNILGTKFFDHLKNRKILFFKEFLDSNLFPECSRNALGTQWTLKMI